MIVIFDLDGTVWDSLPGIVGSLEHTFESFGRDVPDREVLTANIGPPLQQMLGELGFPPEQIDEATLVYRSRYVERGVYEAAVYPGVPELLVELGDAGHRLATATSKGEGPTRQMLDHFGLTEHFEVIGAASMDASSMTKEAVLGRALGELGGPDPSECLMIGDRSYDVRGAAAHGLGCVGVLWGYGTEDELREAGAVHVIGEPSLLPHVKTSGTGDSLPHVRISGTRSSLPHLKAPDGGP